MIPVINYPPPPSPPAGPNGTIAGFGGPDCGLIIGLSDVPTMHADSRIVGPADYWYGLLFPFAPMSYDMVEDMDGVSVCMDALREARS